jgi:hypothetical protein
MSRDHAGFQPRDSPVLGGTLPVGSGIPITAIGVPSTGTLGRLGCVSSQWLAFAANQKTPDRVRFTDPNCRPQGRRGRIAKNSWVTSVLTIVNEGGGDESS